jgi:excinuclease ABC subunit C
MREVLSRRFNPDSTNTKPLPDLLLVDGGKGQLGVAEAVLAELGLTGRMALGAIAKARVKVRSNSGKVSARKASPGANSALAASGLNDRGSTRTEERVFLPGRKNPVTFPINSPALHLIVRIRDETHRSAITFHRKLRAKANRRSMLDEIPGVGPKRKRALLQAFGSLAALRNAKLEEIAAVPGVGQAAAVAVTAFLRTDAGKLLLGATRDGELPPSETPDFEQDDYELAADEEEMEIGESEEDRELDEMEDLEGLEKD